MIPTNQSAVFILTNESARLCLRRRQVGQSSLPQNIKLNWIRRKTAAKTDVSIVKRRKLSFHELFQRYQWFSIITATGRFCLLWSHSYQPYEPTTTTIQIQSINTYRLWNYETLLVAQLPSKYDGLNSQDRIHLLLIVNQTIYIYVMMICIPKWKYTCMFIYKGEHFL